MKLLEVMASELLVGDSWSTATDTWTVTNTWVEECRVAARCKGTSGDMVVRWRPDSVITVTRSE